MQFHYRVYIFCHQLKQPRIRKFSSSQVHKIVPELLDASLTTEELKHAIRSCLLLSRTLLSPIERKFHDNLRRHRQLLPDGDICYQQKDPKRFVRSVKKAYATGDFARYLNFLGEDPPYDGIESSTIHALRLVDPPPYVVRIGQQKMVCVMGRVPCSS